MEDKKLIGKISETFDIKEWNSEEGKQKRITVAKALKNAIVNINKLIYSSLSNKEKAKKTRDYLKASGWITGVYGIFKFIQGSSLNSPEFNLRKFSVDFSDVIELGPTFWLQVALILFTLRIIHKVVSSGVIIANDISAAWKWIKNIFKENVANESEFMSFEEYINLKLLID